jgi:hypothetical protein
MERTGCFGAFLYLNVSPHGCAGFSESYVTIQIAVWDCCLALTWNGYMMTFHMYRIMAFLFFFKKGLSIPDNMWQSQCNKLLYVSLYGPALRHMKLFCLLVLAADLKYFFDDSFIEPSRNPLNLLARIF